MKIAPVTEVKARFSAYLERCQDGPVIVTKNGRPVAVLLSILEDDELERLVLAYTPRFRRLLDAAEQRIQQTGGIGHEEFWKSLEARRVKQETEKPTEPLSTEEILTLAAERVKELRQQPRPVVEAQYQALLDALEAEVAAKGIEVEGWRNTRVGTNGKPPDREKEAVEEKQGGDHAHTTLLSVEHRLPGGSVATGCRWDSFGSLGSGHCRRVPPPG